MRIAAGFAQRYGAVLRPLVVRAGVGPNPADPRPAHEGELTSVLDVNGELAHRYGARHERWYLVRPDGYVGYRGTPADVTALHSYLGRLFTVDVPAAVG